jgi:hypothetical protein
VLLTGRQAANFALHMGDTWLLPEATDKPDLFGVAQEKDLRQSYPGTTTALIRIVEAKGAGNYDMLDTVTDASSKAMLRGGTKEFGKIENAGEIRMLYAFHALPGDPLSLTGAVFANGDKTRRYDVGRNNSLVADTKGAMSEQGTADAIGFGHPEKEKFVILKKDGTLTIDGQPGGTKLWSDGSTASAAAFGNFGEDDRQYAIVIKDDNVYRYPLDGKGDAADFLRMTGERVSTYHREDPKWLAGATASALDVNGDGKVDLLIHTKAGAMMLINRGYGAFFIDADIDKALKSADGKPLIGEKTPWTALDVNEDGLDDLIVLSPETGAVTAVMNAKPADGR